MAVVGAQVSVATTATRIDQASTDTTSGASALVTNVGAADVFLGGSGVTTGAGYKLPPGQSVAVDLSEGNQLFGIVVAGTVTVHVLQVGV